MSKGIPDLSSTSGKNGFLFHKTNMLFIYCRRDFAPLNAIAFGDVLEEVASSLMERTPHADDRKQVNNKSEAFSTRLWA